MRIVERHISKVYGAKWDDVLTLEQQWDAVEARLGGFPPKRRSRLLFGADGSNLFVWEREWESWEMATAAYERLFQDPAVKQLVEQDVACSEMLRDELYTPLP